MDEKQDSGGVGIASNLIKEKVLIDSRGRAVPFNNGLRQAQRDLQTVEAPIEEDEK